MPFSADERDALLAARFVGPMVVQRLEEAGFHDLASLALADAEDICRATAASLGASCWANSPQARQAIGNAIAALPRPVRPRARISRKPRSHCPAG